MKQRNQPQKSHSILGTIKNGMKTGTDQNTDGGGDKSVGDDDDRDGLSRGKQNDDDHIDDGAEKSPQLGESMRDSKSANVR